jgi:hypothetical protein
MMQLGLRARFALPATNRPGGGAEFRLTPPLPS